MYEWDFEGDETYDYSSDTTTVVEHTYENPGSYEARLRVSDEDGLTAIAGRTIIVISSLFHSVSGSVLRAEDGFGIISVTVNLSPGNYTAKTDRFGAFMISGLVNGVYDISVAKDGWVMAPSNSRIVISESDVTELTFYGTWVGGERRGNWWTSGGDEFHTRRSPFVGPRQAGPWGFFSAISPPVIGPNGALYYGYKGPITDPVNGVQAKRENQRLWIVEAQHNNPKYRITSCTIDKTGTAYVGFDNYVYAIEPDGTLNWIFETFQEELTDPVVSDDGTIYIGDGVSLYALNPDGTLKWRYAIGTHQSSPALGIDGTIYVGADDSFLYAFTPEGAIKWQVEASGPLRSSPSVGEDGTIYIASEDGALHAVSPAGILIWSVQTEGQIIDSDPAVGHDGTIYIGSTDNYFYAINPDGSIKWRYKADYPIRTSPVVDGEGAIYFNDVGGGTFPNPPKLYCVSSEGTLFYSNALFYSSPNAKAVFTFNDDGYLMVYQPWSHEVWV